MAAWIFPSACAERACANAARVDPALARRQSASRSRAARPAAARSCIGDVIVGDIYLDRALQPPIGRGARARPSRSTAPTRRSKRCSPRDQIARDSAADQLARTNGRLIERARASFDPERSGDLFVRPQAATSRRSPTPTGYVATHGSPWDYDRRVPILFWRRGMSGSDRRDSRSRRSTSCRPWPRMIGLAARCRARSTATASRHVAAVACPTR